MHQHIENIEEAIKHMRFIEELLWADRPPLWETTVERTERGGVKEYSHQASIALKEGDRAIGAILLNLTARIDWLAEAPRAEYAFRIDFLSADKRNFALSDSLSLGLRHYRFERERPTEGDGSFDPALNAPIQAWKRSLVEFARERDWHISFDENDEAPPKFSGSCSPQDDQCFARFVGMMIFDEIGRVPLPTGV